MRASTTPAQGRSVVVLLAANFMAAAAVVALTTALGKQIYDLTGSELALGLLGLAEFAPNALLVMVTGTLADRYDRRRIATIAMLAQAVCIAGLAWYSTLSDPSVGVIFALVVAWGIARAFAWPAIRALPPDVVTPDRLPWLTVRYSGTFQVAMIVGPVLGGFLYVVDVALPYVAVVALLVLGAVLMSMVRVHTESPSGDANEDAAAAALPTADRRSRSLRRRPMEEERLRAEALLEAATEATDGEPAITPSKHARLREAVEGFVFIRREPVLLGAITLDLFAVLFGGAVALLPAIAEERLGVGAVGLGWLRAAIGVGAAAMTLFLAFRPVRRRIGLTLFAAVAVFGLGTIVLGLTTSFVVAFIALAVLSAADAISVFIRATVVPLVTPADKRGRVLAFEMVFIGASNELGAFESGVAGQLLGPATAIVAGGACALAIAAGWAWLFPSLRTMDGFPGLDDGRPSADRDIVVQQT